ncbi:peptide chain release factor N(5)-glutamine methyltransferase [Leptolyngbya sp. FACHB-36]|uniref:peptide chain release factor N(5)-glutamine methyltransferase n=1 Tax=Leptolyngbya sp. FACHB-36 TaxID=2692808 RepID=UPI00168193B9|nr:peptide chain release factor N(5)-glutamine methyltransferase [Leptolyngbya sp. FACHB-36]MBD2022730.1 peptide chain release factor N(5)-glutamine methyltransferase [Leptolyngbya sp. FACHB-36]
MYFASGLDLWQWRSQARSHAIAAAIPPAEVDWFLQTLTELDRLALRLDSYKDRPRVALQVPLSELDCRWQQRVQNRVPVQYLTGIAPWRQFLLRVSPAVLIPRPETEQLIDLAIATAPRSPLPTLRWADLGTGSGAIAIGLADAFPSAVIHAVDRSAEALAIAQQNAISLGLTERIQFHHGSWFEPLNSLKGAFSGIVSNPPYIPSALVLELQPEVAQHEPHLALDGGTDGLDSIRHLAITAPEYLHPDGVLLLEIMAGQAIAVSELLQAHGCYRDIQTHKDLAGIDRFVLAYRV